MIEFTPLPEIALGPFTLNAHGIFIAIGIVVAYFMFHRKADEKELPKAVKDNLLVILIISGVIGARLLYVATNLDFYAANPSDIIKIWKGGISFLGALIFATVASYVYLKSKKLDFLKVADSVVIPVVIGHFVGRIGDLLAWDHPGTYSELPWAFLINGQPQHPAIIYEMLGLLAVFAVLNILSKRNIFEGKLLFVYFGLYGAVRIVTDTFRVEPTYFGLVLGQIIGALLVMGAITVLALSLTRVLLLKRKGG